MRRLSREVDHQKREKAWPEPTPQGGAVGSTNGSAVERYPCAVAYLQEPQVSTNTPPKPRSGMSRFPCATTRELQRGIKASFTPPKRFPLTVRLKHKRQLADMCEAIYSCSHWQTTYLHTMIVQILHRSCHVVAGLVTASPAQIPCFPKFDSGDMLRKLSLPRCIDHSRHPST